MTEPTEYIFVRDPDDEIVGYGYFHVERMDDDHVWVGMGPGPSVHLHLTYSKGRKVAMHVVDERPDNDPTNRDLPAETIDWFRAQGAAAERERLRTKAGTSRTAANISAFLGWLFADPEDAA